MKSFKGIPRMNCPKKADDEGELTPTNKENAFRHNSDRKDRKNFIKKQYQTGRKILRPSVYIHRR